MARKKKKKVKTCPRCGGVRVIRDHFGPQPIMDCPECGGQGKIEVKE